jgi:hypothetical protein
MRHRPAACKTSSTIFAAGCDCSAGREDSGDPRNRELGVMKKSTWNQAITIEDPETHAWRTIKTVRQAQSFLQDHWPNPTGSRYRQAETACDQALRGEGDTEKVRQAFIDAAIEAHLHLN